MSVRAGTLEEQVLAALDEELGTDRWDLFVEVGRTGHAYSRRQISGALARLHRKGLIHGGRGRETFVWWRRRG